MPTAKHQGGKTGLSETIQLTLRRHPVFSRIRRQFSWDNLLKQSQLQTLKAGQTICREGEPARTAWLVLEGEVKLVRHTTRGQVLLVDITLSGEIFGAVVYRFDVEPALFISQDGDISAEITREFAPYIGVQWLNRFGETADISRRGGGRADDIAVVFGVRLWF